MKPRSDLSPGGPKGGAGKRRRLRSSYADFLPQAQAVSESEAAPMAKVLILAIAGLFCAALFWSALGQVEQVAKAPGVVRPDGRVKIVNHPDGGRVAAILVSEGQRVVLDQVLIELDPEFLKEEIAKLEGEWMSRVVEVARLEAEVEGHQPRFGPMAESSRPDLVAMQRQLYLARRESLDARMAAGDRVVDQRAREAEGVRLRLRQLSRGLAILEEQEAAVSELADKGYFPRLRYLSIKRQVSDLRGQIAETREAGEAALSALAEAENRRDTIEQEWEAETLDRLAQARQERDRIERTLQQERARLRNLAVRAPTAGIVQNIAVAAAGQAIRPNEAVMHVVPTGAELIIEARVSNNDIGHISPGQPATVKIRTYDFVRFGTLEGVVEQIAADAVADPETGQLSFNVLIRTKRSYLGNSPGERPVNPGMQAEVDLHIGKRSILSYLTDRLDRTRQSAFRER